MFLVWESVDRMNLRSGRPVVGWFFFLNFDVICNMQRFNSIFHHVSTTSFTFFAAVDSFEQFTVKNLTSTPIIDISYNISANFRECVDNCDTVVWVECPIRKNWMNVLFLKHNMHANSFCVWSRRWHRTYHLIENPSILWLQTVWSPAVIIYYGW